MAKWQNKNTEGDASQGESPLSRKGDSMNKRNTVEGITRKVDSLDGEKNNTKESKMLKVAVVSKLSHAKGLLKAIKKEGHAPFSFPELTGPIPASMDVIICRVKSTSHEAYDICNEEKRRGTRPVIFENGVGRAVDAIRLIARGTWVDPSLLDQTTERDSAKEEVEEPKDSERQAQRNGCRQKIEDVIQNGNLFTPVLVRRSPSQARDALGAVGWPKKNRVKRPAVYLAFHDLGSFKEATVEAQFESLREEGKYADSTLWWSEETAIGSISVLSRALLNSSQREELAVALTRPGRTYTAEKPEAVEASSVEFAEAEPVADIEEPAEPEEPEKPEEPGEAEGDSDESGSSEEKLLAEKDLRDLLHLLKEQMDKMDLYSITPDHLAEAQLSGTLMVATVHLDFQGNSACGKSSPHLVRSMDPKGVTCNTCKNSKVYTIASYYLSSFGKG